jgi:hypothetical protein
MTKRDWCSWRLHAALSAGGCGTEPSSADGVVLEAMHMP